MTQGESDWEGVSLHVVTGKGGTGKTTVAAALAIALAKGGRTVLLCEVENRQGLARLFDTDPLPYDERRLCSPSDSGELYGLAIDPEAALMEYLELYYRLGRAGRLLDKLGAIDFATTIAPGVRDVLLTGKVYEAVRRKTKDAKRVKGRPTYDAVVLDAPPTGRVARFLNVNAGVADIARVGPIRQQADSIMRMVRSPQTVVHLVTLLEEMAVQETTDGIAELREAGIPVGGVVMNFVRRTPFSDADLKRAAANRLGRTALAAFLKEAGLPAGAGVVSGLLTEARDHALRVLSEQDQRSRLVELGRPLYELPYVNGDLDGGAGGAGSAGIDLGTLFTLAETLEEQGMA